MYLNSTPWLMQMYQVPCRCILNIIYFSKRVQWMRIFGVPLEVFEMKLGRLSESSTAELIPVLVSIPILVTDLHTSFYTSPCPLLRHACKCIKTNHAWFRIRQCINKLWSTPFDTQNFCQPLWPNSTWSFIGELPSIFLHLVAYHLFPFSHQWNWPLHQYNIMAHLSYVYT